MKKLLLIAVAILFVLPMAVMADPVDRDSYLRSNPSTVQPPSAGWEGPFAPGAPIGWNVADGGDVYIGILNEFVWVNMKTVTILVEGTGATDWELATVEADGGPAGYRVVNVTYMGPSLILTIEIFPQPDWEVIVLHNFGGAGAIGTITITSECELVPSMTGYGLGILALLLIGSTVWVLRRRRVGSVA